MNDSGVGRKPALGLFPDGPTPRLYDRVVEVLRTRHYSRRTEEAYVHWIRRFVLFHAGSHPGQLAEGDVNRFLTWLAVKENVAASTQNQALAALLFLYEQVLEQPLNRIEGVVRARKPKRLPTVLTPEEVDVVLDQLDGVPCLVCNLQYGGGLRVLEALQLRVKDLDFGRGETMLRDVKGRVDHVTMLPEVLHQPLQDHLRLVREQHEADLALGLGRAPLPYAPFPEAPRKYPHADREWAWQWIFPASSYYLDRRTGLQHRHHLHESVVQKGGSRGRPTRGRANHHDLHPRVEPRRGRGSQPSGPPAEACLRGETQRIFSPPVAAVEGRRAEKSFRPQPVG